MSTIVTRLFAERGAAEAAQAALARQIRSAEDLVQLIDADPAATEPGERKRRLAEQLAQAQVEPAAAEAYAAEAVRRGGTLVVVDAPFGSADWVISTLQRHGAVALDTEDRYVGAFSGAPFSEALGLPLLWNEPAPLSRLFGLAVVSSDSRSNTPLVDEPAPLSRLFGLPLLRKGSASRSSSFGLPMLSHKAAPLSGLFGLPVLKKGSEARTTSFGLPLLSNNPTPLSSLLGLKVLSDPKD